MTSINSPSDESAPLLGAVGGEAYVGPDKLEDNVHAGFISTPDELPPPYAPSSIIGGKMMIACRVCGSMMDITGKKEQHVVKCDSCNEATPVKQAPAGKKYVRCPCNCLLICKQTAQRIACPRANCKRIINLASERNAGSTFGHAGMDDNAISRTNAPGYCQVICGHCGESFIFNTLSNVLARCPHCRKYSSVGNEFARTRGVISTGLFIIFLAIAIVLTVATHTLATGAKGLIVVYALLFLISIVFLVRATYFLTMKISTVLASP